MLAAGALALAVSAPVLEPVTPSDLPHLSFSATAAQAATPILEARTRPRVASRAAVRRSVTRPAATALRAAQRQVLAVRSEEESRRADEARLLAERMAAVERQVAAERRARAVAASPARAVAARPARAVAARPARARPVVRKRVVRRAVTVRPRATGARARMASVIAFARAQVGKRYSRGGEGPNSFDCSGFTKRAYARAGLRLPHSSGGQAARARVVSRAAARPGDLVVGAGHVGIYMGRGMMIDAGNPRTGVVYRRLYAGLHIERF
ncbi:NlpC/P60 family protein [Actinoplanes sp. NPDC049548]|uniref:C40 family peptidase n=1 Tax=Actinoplanes sp. NPDC049548 TaxID=3155152 RepID=UPI00342110D2